ncbi:unnamed protein product [Durusdinium trenchii]|uniref:HIT domain-containing protein n=1 Tax=Durusdinium trenchii TaxID=1381693 RepID=A0ABP0R5M8_9DINO
MRWPGPRGPRSAHRLTALVSAYLWGRPGFSFSAMASGAEEVIFGEMRLASGAVLLRSKSSVALQGLQPILPGHSVVVPWPSATRLCELSEDAMKLESTASNWAVFDGWPAGQPVPHAHVHVVPRKPNDLEKNDQVYEALERWVPSSKGAACPPSIEWPEDEARRKRTGEEMAAEALSYRAVMPGSGSFPEEQAFASFQIPGSHIFYASELTVGFVNLKPLVPGHVLVVPKRAAPRMEDLSAEEFEDLFRSVRLVQGALEGAHGAEASRLGIQDGADAGQTVPHVHVHILPIPLRKAPL